MSEVRSSEPASSSAAIRTPGEPLRIWEIEGRLQCPVIGACLTVSESRILLKKVGLQSRRLSPYGMHRVLMEHLNDRNRLSLKVDAYLRHKYRHSVPHLLALAPEAFMESWREAFRRGDIEAGFYCATIRGDLSPEAMGEIFGETHMLCHANLDEVMKARRQVAFHVDVNRKLVRSLDKERVQARQVKRKNKELQQSLVEAVRSRTPQDRRAAERPPAEHRNVEPLAAENRSLRRRVEKEQRRVRELEVLLQRSEKERERLEKETAGIEALNRNLSEDVSWLIAKMGDASRDMASCEEHCSRSSLCARRVLVVGGLTRMKDLYRRLVESHGGRFEYHDGYMKRGKQDLDAQVRRADMILCPVSCNSHAACLMVKKLSAKYGKTFRMLPSSGLSYLSRELLVEEVESAN